MQNNLRAALAPLLVGSGSQVPVAPDVGQTGAAGLYTFNASLRHL